MNARILDIFRVLRKYEVPLQIRICNALETNRQPRTSEFGLQSRRVHDARQFNYLVKVRSIMFLRQTEVTASGNRRWGLVPVQCVSLHYAPRPQLHAPGEGAAAWKFEIQINITERGIVNARHKATPALPYTRCLTHPDVYPRCFAGETVASRVYYSPVMFTLLSRVDLQKPRLSMK